METYFEVVLCLKKRIQTGLRVWIRKRKIYENKKVII